MKYLGVIAGPDKVSLSPVFQQAALDAVGLDIVYQAWPTPPDGLGTRVATLRGDSSLGANVTIPHKQSIVHLVDEVDETASTVGAVNTVVNHEGRLSGHNTDVEGFLRALREDGEFDPAGSRVVVAGAGGAARAVVAALFQAKAATVTVINRSFEKASTLVEDLSPLSADTSLNALPDQPASWESSSAGCDLLINCTPAGSSSKPAGGEGDNSAVPLEILRSEMFVYDLVYLPAETPLMVAARACGARVLGGLPMLIYQGAASFQMWTGREAPVGVMLAAARAALGTAPR
jgi:shikimate dehydrogenase